MPNDLHIFPKDGRDIRRHMTLDPIRVPTYVSMLAIHQDPRQNHTRRIYCLGCAPIRGYTYCAKSDSCLFECFDSCDLGSIPISYTMSMHGAYGWSAKIPVPEPVIRRYLNRDQKRKLRNFVTKFREMEGQISYSFVQMVSSE